MLDERDQFKFSKVMLSRTSHGRSFNYRRLQLPWQGDCTNVINPYKNEGIVIGTERGNLIYFSLKHNKPVAVLESDEQLSGVALSGGYLWSVGRQRKITCQHPQTGIVYFTLSESKELGKYSDVGIILHKSYNRDFLIYNSGGLRFTIIHLRSRKVVKRIDIAKLLENNPTFEGFTAAQRVCWRYGVGRVSSKIFIAINRYHPHIIIFDYLTNRVDMFKDVFQRIDWKTGSVVPVIGMHILVALKDDYIFFVNQVRDPWTKEIRTYFRVLVLNRADREYKVFPLREFPSRLDLTSSNGTDLFSGD